MIQPDSPKRVHLTNESVKKLPATGAWYSVADDEVVGLQVRVTPQGGKVYQVRCRHRDGRRLTITIGPTHVYTVKQARDEAVKRIAEARQGVDPNAEKRALRKEAEERRANTLGAFIEGEYARNHLALCKSGDETLQRLKACFKADFWDLPLHAITPAAVAGWISGRQADGRSNATINRDVTCLKGVLTKAFKWGRIEAHPLHKRVDYLKEDREEEARELTLAEEKRLLKALDARQDRQREKRRSHNEWLAERHQDPWPSLDDVVYTDHLKPMVELSLQTGMRQNEVYSLEWSDVDLVNRRITVRGSVAKSGNTRYIPLNDAAIDILTTWRNEGEHTGLTKPTGYVFPSPKGGGKIDNTKRAWSKVLQAASIEGFVWHDLRATFASRLVNSGANLYAVKMILGHKSITTTERYLKSDEAHQMAAVNLLVRPANVVPFEPRKETDEVAIGTSD